MKEYTINNKKRLCFLVKKGDANDIVIDYDSLAHIDVKRLYEMEAQGGEMMRVMRDTTLDNGVNALVMYKDLFRVVPVEQKVAPVTKDAGVDDVKTAPAVKKRGRGRPRKNAIK